MAFKGVKEGPVDRGSFARFCSSIDPEWIAKALSATGKASIRRRRLPAEQVIWLVLGMALFRDLSIEEVVRELALALPSANGVSVVPSAAIQARGRLGPDPLRWLFEHCASVWVSRNSERNTWRGLALYSVDGTTVHVPDSAENRQHFGDILTFGPRRYKGRAAYPRARMVTLMSLRSHLISAARFGAYTTGEFGFAEDLWARIPDNSLTILDRYFYSARVLMPLRADGHNRHWLIRAKTNIHAHRVKSFSPDDELVELRVSLPARQRDRELPAQWVARAVRYERKGFRPSWLLTSLLDPAEHPAAEIVRLYHERWEIELGYDEVKTEMLEREEAIRSKKPAGVEQELWGLLLAYNLIRLEMRQVAIEAKVPETRISFVAALRLIRSTLLGLVFASPGAIPQRLIDLRSDIRHFVLPERRPREYPRAVKIRTSPYPSLAVTKRSQSGPSSPTAN